MPVIMFGMWLLLNGRVTVEIMLIGAAVTLLIWGVMLRFLDWSVKRDLIILKTAPIFLIYLLNLVRETLTAAVRVTLVALNPRNKPDPVIVEFSSGIHREGLNVILANSITLTPGTITVRQEGDRFQVHCLRKEYADGLAESSFVKLLRRFPK